MDALVSLTAHLLYRDPSTHRPILRSGFVGALVGVMRVLFLLLLAHSVLAQKWCGYLPHDGIEADGVTN